MFHRRIGKLLGLIVVTAIASSAVLVAPPAQAQTTLYEPGLFECRSALNNPFGSTDYDVFVFPPEGVRALNLSGVVYWKVWVKEWRTDRTHPAGGEWRWRTDLTSGWMRAKASISQVTKAQFYDHSTSQEVRWLHFPYRALFQDYGSYWAFYSGLYFQRPNGTWHFEGFWSQNNTSYLTSMNRWYCPPRPLRI